MMIFFFFKRSTVGLFLAHLACQVLKVTACNCFPGSGGNRSGVYCVHRGHHKDANFSSLVCPLFHHALLPWALHYVWKYRGSGGSSAGPKDLS